MGVMDKVKGLFKGNANTAKSGVDKAGQLVDDRTGNKYDDKIDKAAERAKGGIDSMNNDAGAPGQNSTPRADGIQDNPQ